MLQWGEKSSDYRSSLIPLFFFPRELFAPGTGELVILRLTVVVRGAPLRSNPTLLLQLQQRRIKGAVIEREPIAASLFDTARDSLSMKRSERIERLQYH